MPILNTKPLLLSSLPLWILLMLVIPVQSQEFCTESGVERFAGKVGDYNYELWNQYGQGTGCMTVGSHSVPCIANKGGASTPHPSASNFIRPSHTKANHSDL